MLVVFVAVTCHKLYFELNTDLFIYFYTNGIVLTIEAAFHNFTK